MANTIPSPIILAKEAIRQLPSNTVLRNWVDTKYSGTIRKQGDTVQVQTFPKLVLNSPSNPNGAISAQNLAITTENLVADTTKAGRVQLGDLEASNSNLDLEKEIASSMAEAMAQEYETAIAAKHTSAPTSNRIATLALTKNNIFEAVTALKQKLAEKNVTKDIGLFLRPEVTRLLKLASLISGTDTGYQEGLNGKVGMIDGMTVFETNNAPAGKMLAFQKGAIHLADKLTKIDVREGTDGFYSNIMLQMTYGTGVFNVEAERIATHAYTIA